MSENTVNLSPDESSSQLRELLKRCDPKVIEAAIEFQKTGSSENIFFIVRGIIERFLEPELRPKLHEEGSETTDLIEELGVDSLDMVEIVSTIEETFKLSIPNEDLLAMKTLKDIDDYIKSRFTADSPVLAASNG